MRIVMKIIMVTVVLCWILAPTYCQCQIPSPTTNQVFMLPLSDGTSAEGMFLQTPSAALWLVYATPAGKLGFWTLTQSTPTPPTPPPPDRVIAHVVTIAEDEPAQIPPGAATEIAAAKADYNSYTISMVSSDDPPENALFWIGKSAGKKYPYTFLADKNNNVLWQGATPETEEAWAAILKSPGTARKKQPSASPIRQPLKTSCPDCEGVRTRRARR
jgi:hypothetical protein